MKKLTQSQLEAINHVWKSFDKYQENNQEIISLENTWTEEDGNEVNPSDFGLTKKECDFLLNVVKPSQSDYTISSLSSDSNLTKSEGGLISSLEKKGFIFDSAPMKEENPTYKVWCMTKKACDAIGTPTHPDFEFCGWEFAK
tara:strand:+ start:209 stop:634 length:426 start_codon:yes stop_codon:yes gene_type:complete